MGRNICSTICASRWLTTMRFLTGLDQCLFIKNVLPESKEAFFGLIITKGIIIQRENEQMLWSQNELCRGWMVCEIKVNWSTRIFQNYFFKQPNWCFSSKQDVELVLFIGFVETFCWTTGASEHLELHLLCHHLTAFFFLPSLGLDANRQKWTDWNGLCRKL